MNITPEIKTAIKKAIDLHGNVTQFAKHMGIAHSTVLFWLSGKTTEVSGRLWAQKLRPSLLPFLGDREFSNRPLPRKFFSDMVPSSGRDSTMGAYEPWTETTAPNNVVCRLACDGRVLGIVSNHSAYAGHVLVTTGADGSDTVKLSVNYKTALQLLEIHTDDDIWVPAGTLKPTNAKE